MIGDTLSLIIQTLTLLVSLAILVKSSDVVSDSSASVARITGLGEVAIGFLMLAVTTSLPELAVSILAINSGETSISVGMLIGSNIANIGLVLGLTAITVSSPLIISKDSLRKLVLMLFPPTLIPVLLLISASVSRIVGVILLFGFGLFCIQAVKSRTIVEDVENPALKGGRLSKELFKVALGISIIIISAYFVVDSAVYVAGSFGIDNLVISATIIALGTSLPELSVSLAAAKKNHIDLALGNILGSCFTNLTLILGLSLAASGFGGNAIIFFELIVLLSIMNFALWRMLIDSRIDLFDGLILVLLYLVFVGTTTGLQLFIIAPDTLSHIPRLFATFSAKVLSVGLVSAIAIFLGRFLTKDLTKPQSG